MSKKTKIITRLLVIIILTATLGISAFAMTLFPGLRLSAKEAGMNNESSTLLSELFVSPSYIKIFDWNKIDNIMNDEDARNHWAVVGEHAPNLVNAGVLYPVLDSVTGPQAYEILLDDPISGKDALGLALFYFWPNTYPDGYQATVGASGSNGLSARKDTYTRAATIFNNNTQNTIGTLIDNSASLQRQEAAYLIAKTIERKSGGAINLGLYSNNRIGYYNLNTRVIRHVTIPSESFLADFDIDGQPIVDNGAGITRPEYIQAVNMLIDLGQIAGRPGDIQGQAILAGTGIMNYAEFYKMLVTADRNYDDMIPVYSEINANLSITSGIQQVNYKDFMDGALVYAGATFNASATYSRANVASYAFSAVDAYGNNPQTTASSITSLPFVYDKSAIFGGRTILNASDVDRSYSLPFSGHVTVTDVLGGTGSASAAGSNSIFVNNNAPVAGFTASTDILSDGIYSELYHYINESVTITDLSTDYEDAGGIPVRWTYIITRGGAAVASSDDFGSLWSNPAYVSSFAADPETKQLSVTFTEPGAYVITAYVWDEMGKMNAAAGSAKTLTVTGEPEPPTAKIDGKESIYTNRTATYKDISTDPNNDIVKAEWGTIQYYVVDEPADENDDAAYYNRGNPDAVPGQWVDAVSGENYTGSLNNSTRTSLGSMAQAAGTLQFKKFGTYKITLTVTDATGLTSTAYKYVDVIPDIPIIEPNDPKPPTGTTYYTVTFINSNSNITNTQVQAGKYVKQSKVPAIVDMPGYAEFGWTIDGKQPVDPTAIPINGNITFCVLMFPSDGDPNNHNVFFINTDGAVETIKVPHNSYPPADEVPPIVDDPDLEEYGWTTGLDSEIVEPSSVKIVADTLFWVKTDRTYGGENHENEYPYYDDEGVLHVKQNRLALIDLSQSMEPEGDPIQEEKTEWVVEAVGGYILDNIKWEHNDPGGRLVNGFIAKEVGEFTVTITLHNNYSDNLAEERPESNLLRHRTMTIPVVVHPDLPPEVSIYVMNANPNFHTNGGDNPKTNVILAATAVSHDFDGIGTYEWVVWQDTNNDGSFDDETAPIFQQSGPNLPTVSFEYAFRENAVGRFKAILTVTETFGQPTLPQYITDEDYLKDTAVKIFEVNWTPTIWLPGGLTFNNNGWAYVDDTVTVSAQLKDEFSTTSVTSWRLRRLTPGGFEYVDPASLPTVTDNVNHMNDKGPIWALGQLGGDMRITKDGNYQLEAKITDAQGYSEIYLSGTIRIYNLPTAVISDDPDYRWLFTQWQYKQSRRFDLDGLASYPQDSTGPALHQLDHTKDVWSITPITGNGTVDDIYVMAPDGVSRKTSTDGQIFKSTLQAFDDSIAIIKPGTYLVSYQVANEYGKKSPVTTRLITIAEDTEPIVDIGSPNTRELLGSEAVDKYVTLGMTEVTVRSDDQDIVGTDTNFIAQYRYDSDDDGSFDDEQWKDCTANFTTNGAKSLLNLSMTARVREVGMYQFQLTVKEAFGQETLPIVPDSTRWVKTFYHEVEADNTRPQGTFGISNKVYGDVVFAMGKSDNVSAVSDKTQNFANSFGTIPGSSVFQLDVQTIKTSTLNMQTAFNWVKCIESNGVTDAQLLSAYNTWLTNGHQSTVLGYLNGIGGIAFANGGSTVIMNGNSYTAGSGFTYIEQPKSDDTQVIQFGYDVDYGDSLINTYFIFGLSRSGNTLTGWGIDLSGNYTYYNGASLVRVTLNTLTNAISTTSIKSLGLPKTGTIKIKIIGESCEIYRVVDGTDAFVSSATLTGKAGDGYAFGLKTQNHSCSYTGMFALTDISLQITDQKTLSDTITDVSFNLDHNVFIIWTEDNVPQELDPASPTYNEDFAKLVAMLKAQNAHLIIFGSSANQAAMQHLLNQLQVSGTFVNVGSNVDAAIQTARNFIANVLLQEANADVKYVLVGQDTVYSKYYADFNGDPQWHANGNGTDTINSAKWWYSHDPDYFTNKLGLLNANQQWMANEITTFNNTGKYLVNYMIKDNPVPDAYRSDNSTNNPFNEYRYWSNNYGNDEVNANGVITNPHAEIYVHRRPIADFSVITRLTPQGAIESITVTDMAYDLDHYEPGNPASRPDKGLQRFEWSWQLTNDTTQHGAATFSTAADGVAWINAQLAAIDYKSDTNVLITYRVQDIDGVLINGIPDGVWSNYTTLHVTNKSLPPIARFTTNKIYFDLNLPAANPPRNNPVIVTDQSYSPNGNNINIWAWEITNSKNGTNSNVTYSLSGGTGISVSSKEQMQQQFSTYVTNLINSKPLGLTDEDNTYKITLTVTDDKSVPLTSDPYSVTIVLSAENSAPTAEGTASSFYKNGSGVMVYQYDPYDKDTTSGAFVYSSGILQNIGSEIDWTLILDDPDNHDSYGTANDSDNYLVGYKTERFADDILRMTEQKTITNITDDKTPLSSNIKVYEPKAVTAAQALTTYMRNIAPFTGRADRMEAENLDYGVYRITTTVTDQPNNGRAGISVESKTNPVIPPKHLYVIPALTLEDIHCVRPGTDEEIPEDERITIGDTVTITCITNYQTTGVNVLLPDGRGDTISIAMVLDESKPIEADGTKHWKAEVTIPTSLESHELQPDGGLEADDVLRITVEAWTDYGVGDGFVTRTKSNSGLTVNVLTIKLFDFRITGISDTSVGFAGNPVYAADLAYDRSNSPNETLMKRGYAFYFEIDSKGMQGEDTGITITPRFYGYNTATGTYNIPLSVWYKVNGKYVEGSYSGSKSAEDTFVIRPDGGVNSPLWRIGSITLGVNDRTTVSPTQQTWSGFYGLPGTAIFVKSDGTVYTNEQKGVLVAFEIGATKDGAVKYDYIGSDQWNDERVYLNPLTGVIEYRNPNKWLYQDGSVIVMDTGGSAANDFKALPVWRQTRGY